LVSVLVEYLWTGTHAVLVLPECAHGKKRQEFVGLQCSRGPHAGIIELLHHGRCSPHARSWRPIDLLSPKKKLRASLGGVFHSSGAPSTGAVRPAWAPVRQMKQWCISLRVHPQKPIQATPFERVTSERGRIIKVGVCLTKVPRDHADHP